MNLLIEFLVELQQHGKISWDFDEQQADPTHKFWKEKVAGWLYRLRRVDKDRLDNHAYQCSLRKQVTQANDRASVLKHENNILRRRLYPQK